MKHQRLIIVSNRLPVQITENNGRLLYTPASGGLVSSIKSYLNTKSGNHGGNSGPHLWVGAVEIPEKKFLRFAGNENKVEEGFELVPTFLPRAMQDKFYNGFCNDTIWPLFHYFPSVSKFNSSYYENYVAANGLFCKKIVQHYRPGDIIWIHDYHLLLLPAMLRSQLPQAEIGFFLHIPFPSFEVFRLMPGQWRKELLNGLLGADLVGFHTHDYAQYFIQSVKHTLGYKNVLRGIKTPDRYITINAFPVGIDFEKFNSAADDADIQRELHRIKKHFSGTRLVISIDRLDYSKGVVNRLESLELFFENNPTCRGRVTYILVVVPSRDIITKYKEIKTHIEILVSRINGRYGSIGWIPVIYQYRFLDFGQLAALYLAADIGLVTPVRDGMNLVAKEFVATRKDLQGILILSETTGAATELNEAIIINPTDRHEVADAIIRALEMPANEQAQRMEIMQKRLKDFDVVKWVESFISELKASKKEQEVLKIKSITPVEEKNIVKNYAKAEKRLIFLDYDGTLAPLVRLPHLAVPTKSVLQTLEKLGNDEKNTIVLISGRTSESLEEWFGGLPVNIVAEHGAYCKKPGADWEQILQGGTGWKSEVLPLLNQFTERCEGSFIEHKNFSVAWHYRNAEKDTANANSHELVNMLEPLASHYDFQVMEGSKVVEVRSRGINKGQAAFTWLANDAYDFNLAIGDDNTDEDLFRVMPPAAYTIRVGIVQSLARYNLWGQEEVLKFLTSLQNTDATIAPGKKRAST